jgi:hypothetical protein
LKDSVAQLSESLSKIGTDTGLPVHGFADVGAGWSHGKDPIPLHGFNGGTLDLYLTPQFGNRIKSLVELAVEYGDDGGVAVDMERLQLGYTVDDALTVWAGRFHTPFGLWNTSFHHGANLQTSIYRPRFIDFEDKGGFIPAHSVGVWGSGKTDISVGKLRYDVFVANGPSIRGRVLDFNAYTDPDASKLLGFNLGLSPSGRMAGWTFGVHGFAPSRVSTFDSSDAVMSQSRLRMLGGYFGYDDDDWEAVGEFYHFDNSGISTSGKHHSDAWFVQLGKTWGLWTPYLRLEQARLDAQDLYFTSQETGRSYKRLASGVRYALDPRASLKFEFSTTREDETTLVDESGGAAPFSGVSYRRVALQYSVAF